MQPIRTFADANHALSRFRHVAAPGRYTLDRIIKFMDYLGDPQNNLKVVHVAGTSGKSSTCYYIAALFLRAGCKVGLTVSPHVDEINERLQIDLRPLEESLYCEHLGNFLSKVYKSGIQLSYFEVLVAFAYFQFAQQKVKYAVVEVGLGGLLDGTNVVARPDKVCVITDIGLDHIEVLGTTLTHIARQKAGIIHPGNHVFMLQQPAEVMEPVATINSEQRAILHIETAHVASPSLPLFQQRNLSLAEAVVNYTLRRDGHSSLDISDREQASKVYIPARMEMIAYHDKTIILDGSHNDQKVGALVRSIQARFEGVPAILLVSFGTNKGNSLQPALEQLRCLGDHIVITTFSTLQDEKRTAIEPAVVAGICRRLGFKTMKTIADPVQALHETLVSSEQLAVITGSYYLLNHIRPQLRDYIRRPYPTCDKVDQR